MVKNKNPLIVAELTINHLGMVSIAKKMIDSAIESGASAVKLKYKNVKKYYNDDSKKWRNFNFKDYRNSLELSKEDFLEISKYCESKNIKWFCTVHDLDGLEFIKSLNPPYYKVASMDVDKENFVNEVISICKQKQKPLIVSLGGKDKEFTDALVKKINDSGIQSYLLHTVSIYPTPIGKSNINYIKDLKNLYESEKIKIGYSGHEIGFSASIVSSIFGVEMIERHFTLSKNYKIHHIKSALCPDEFKNMVSQICEINEEITSAKTTHHPEEFEFLKERKYI